MIATKGITVRVRKSIPTYETKKNNYYFTMKVSTNGRCIEVEKKLDERDFNDLWEICLNKLEKIRYEVKDKGNIWEVDYFKDCKNETYIAVAEIELPEGISEPSSIPYFIKNNLIYKVEQIDSRFSNKVLACERYAKKLLKEVLKN